MSAEKILFVSDLHCDAVTGGVKRFDDAFGFLEDLNLDGVGAIIFCGDLADPDGVDSHACVVRFADVVKGWTVRGIDVYAVPGNHDVVEDGRGTTILDCLDLMDGGNGGIGAVLSKPGWFETCGVRVGVLPYTARAFAYDPAAAVERWANGGKRIDLFVGHLNVEGHGPGSETTDMPRGREVFWPLDQIAHHYPNAACIGGHYHKGTDLLFRDQKMPGGIASQRLHIVGAPARFTFGEASNSPSYSVLDPKTMTIERVAIADRQVVTLGRLDATGILNGAIVRLAANEPRAEVEEFAREELTKKRGCTVVLGKDTVISAPTEPVRASGEVYEDPVQAARRLAEEWPAVEAEAEAFRAELVGLVDTIAQEEP